MLVQKKDLTLLSLKPVYGVWKNSARSHACRVQALRAVRSRVCITPVKTVKRPQSKTSCKKSIINQGFPTRGLTSFSSKCQHKKMLKIFYLVFFYQIYHREKADCSINFESIVFRGGKHPFKVCSLIWCTNSLMVASLQKHLDTPQAFSSKSGGWVPVHTCKHEKMPNLIKT